MYAVVVFALLAVVGAQDFYTKKFDSVDVDAILSNERLANNYFHCFMDSGICTPEGEEVKKHILEALQTKCAKCNEKQKKEVMKVFKFLSNDKSDKFLELVGKYDPDGTYRKMYKDVAEAEGIKI